MEDKEREFYFHMIQMLLQENRSLVMMLTEKQKLPNPNELAQMLSALKDV